MSMDDQDSNWDEDHEDYQDLMRYGDRENLMRYRDREDLMVYGAQQDAIHVHVRTQCDACGYHLKIGELFVSRMHPALTSLQSQI